MTLPRKSYSLFNPAGQLRLNELTRLSRDAARSDLFFIAGPFSQSPAGLLLGASASGGTPTGPCPCASPVAFPAQDAFLSDLFTDVDGTALTAHKMDLGPGWQQGEGTFDILHNAAECKTITGRFPAAWSGAGQADVTLTVTVTLSAMGKLHGLALRVASAANRWRIGIDGNVFDIREMVGDAETVRATANFPAIVGVPYTIQCVALGPSLKATVNGGVPIAYGGAITQQMTGNHGVDAGAPLAAVFNNFQAGPVIQ